MPPQQLDIEEIQLREVQAITGRIYSPTISSTAMLLEECASSKRRSTKWLDDDDDDELMPLSSTTNTTLAQPKLSRRITPDNTPSQTIPQHWPISATSSDDIKGHVRPLPFDVFSKKKKKDTNNNKGQGEKEREERPPVYFYSINTMLHQQEEECWENVISDDTEEDSDEDMLLLGELIQDACRQCQPRKSCLRKEDEVSAPPRISKSVNFSIEEISSTHSRPRTSTKDIPNLYYTENEIYTMKCNYRKERKEERKEEKIKAMEE